MRRALIAAVASLTVLGSLAATVPSQAAAANPVPPTLFGLHIPGIASADEEEFTSPRFASTKGASESSSGRGSPSKMEKNDYTPETRRATAWVAPKRSFTDLESNF